MDPVTKTVIPKTLNLRAGPGENYSVVGTLDQGTVVNELLRKDRWMQIATPPGAYAFVAAEFLRQEPMVAPVVSAEPPPAAPEIAVVELPTAPAPAAPAELEPPAAVVEPKPAPVAVVEPAPAAPAKPVQPPPKRIVQREGIVRYTWNIQAPTSYVLVSPDSGETINYLYTTSTNLNLKRYRGLRILVSGEEGLDSRWTNTPIITIQRIHVIE